MRRKIEVFGDGSSTPRPDPEAQVVTLKEALERSRQPPPEVGSFVTPRVGSGLDDDLIGEPHIVLRVLTREESLMNDPRSEACVSVGYIDAEGDYMQTWTEAIRLEPWTPELCAAARARRDRS